MTARVLHRVLPLGAVAGLLASSVYVAVPAFATGDSGDSAAPGAAPADTVGAPPAPGTSDGGPRLSEAALAEAVARDLGLTPEQFSTAGELGARAAAAAVQLREVPGYAGIRLDAGRIVVAGSGPALLEKVAALAASTPELVLAAPPDTEPPAAPDTASAGGPELAVSTGQLFQAYVREVGTEGLQAVMAADGKFIIRTGPASTPESTADTGQGYAPAAGSGKVSPAEFVARYANVELDGGTRLTPEADVPGGLGYIADTRWICSTGFSAFDATGLPAVLTAGHCTSDGAAQSATLELQGERAGFLGEFGFSQFGGPGNSRVLDPATPKGTGDIAITDPGNVGTDISVLTSLREDLDPLPAASTWGNPSQPNPDVKVIGTADPVLGMPVCRSGRTSAWSCGTVDAVGIFVIPGPAYQQDPTDLRAIDGFLSYGVQSSGGDSGGPYVSGNYAVGTHAAGDTPDANGVIQNFAVAATLSRGLAVLPGYQLELFLNKPTVTDPAPGGTYEPGQTVTGTVPAAPASAIAAGSSVRITLAGEQFFDVPVDAAGNWRFTAPGSPGSQGGPLTFTAQTLNGFSRSGTASFQFALAQAVSADSSANAGQQTGGHASGAGQANPTGTAQTGTGPAPAPAAGAPGGSAAVVRPAAEPPAAPAGTGRPHAPVNTGSLAYTGSGGLLPAAGAALAAIVVGGVLMVLVKRRKRGSGTPGRR